MANKKQYRSMDKKEKLINSHIGKAIGYSDKAHYELQTALNIALEELSKSDWVSVEDGLPPKNVVVRVCNKQNPDDLVLAYRTSKETMKIVYPNNVAMYTITHWCKIEKLED